MISETPVNISSNEFSLRVKLRNGSKYNVFWVHGFKTIKKRQGFSLFLEFSLRVTLKNDCKYNVFWVHGFKNIKKRQGFSLFLNNSIGVTEHFLHTSNEISISLKFTIQKYQKTTRISTIFEVSWRCEIISWEWPYWSGFLLG